MLGVRPAGRCMSLPLEGVKVLDLSRLLPGGFCSLLLADFGAEVLKVEDTGMGDYVRWAPPKYEGAEDSAAGALFLALNRNKRSIRIDLKTDGGREVLLRLAREHDVVLESFRPGVLDRLGVGYERLREENPGLVYCAITGYGQDGPLRDRSGHDMNYLGLVGLLGLTGDGRRPAGPGRGPDRRHRRRRADGGVRDPRRAARARPLGRGPARRRLDGRRRAVAGWPWSRRATSPRARRPQRGELELAGRLVCYRPYACADGWVTLGALEPKFWAAWCRGVGPRGPDRAAVRAAGLDHPRRGRGASSWSARASEWSAFASEHDCCLEPVLDLDEALDSELVREREMVVELDQPGAERPRAAARRAGQALAHARPTPTAARPRPRRADRRGAARRSATTTSEIAALKEAGAVAGPGQRRARGPSWHDDRRRPAQDERAGRAVGRLRGHDQALPARGAARRTPRAHLAQHGLLPARVRRAHPADQAPPGGALHAAAGDQGRARRRPRAGGGAGRARGPDPRARDQRAGVGPGLARRGQAPLRDPRERARPHGGARRADARPRAATTPTTWGSSRRSRASAPAATTSRSASPSTTRCATASSCSRWSRRRSGCCSTAWPARSRSTARWRSSRPGSEPLRDLIGAVHSKLLLAELRRQRNGRRP